MKNLFYEVDNDGWIKIEDGCEMPERRVLVDVYEGFYKKIRALAWDDNFYCPDGSNFEGGETHWRPRAEPPEPPEENCGNCVNSEYNKFTYEYNCKFQVTDDNPEGNVSTWKICDTYKNGCEE